MVHKLRVFLGAGVGRIGALARGSTPRDSYLKGDKQLWGKILGVGTHARAAAATRAVQAGVAGIPAAPSLWAGRLGMGRITSTGRGARGRSSTATEARSSHGGGSGGGHQGHGGIFGIKRAIYYVVCGGGAGLMAYLLYGGAVARREAREVKVRWGKARDLAEKEIAELEDIPFSVTLPRALHLGMLFFPLVSLSVPTLALTMLEGDGGFVSYTFGWAGDMLRSTWLLVLRLTLERSGAAFIKWGQWAATRPDIFPRAMCEALHSLHDQVRASPSIPQCPEPCLSHPSPPPRPFHLPPAWPCIPSPSCVRCRAKDPCIASPASPPSCKATIHPRYRNRRCIKASKCIHSNWSCGSVNHHHRLVYSR